MSFTIKKVAELLSFQSGKHITEQDVIEYMFEIGWIDRFGNPTRLAIMEGYLMEDFKINFNFSLN